MTPKVETIKKPAKERKSRAGYVGRRQVAIPVTQDTYSRVSNTDGTRVTVRTPKGCCLPDGDSFI